MSTSTSTDHSGRLIPLKSHPGRAVLLIVIVFLVIAGGTAYYLRARQVALANAETTSRTATVRQGNLVISASGSGTLVAADERDLAFSTSGQVTDVFVKPGDYVQAGAILAQIDGQQAQIAYAQAKNAYQELTSTAAIATAQEQVAQAQTDLMSAKYHLEYLISPDVMYWETEIAKGEQALQQARATAESSTSDQDAQQAVKKAEDFLGFAHDKLDEAWKLYYDEYVPKNFRLVEDKKGNDSYLSPTDLEIQLARTGIDEAQKKLDDSQLYYDVLTGAPMPEGASSDSLIQLQQAEQKLQDAQATMEGTKITAPIDGTILSVDAAVGNIVDTSPVIVMADLSQLKLDFYMDETDWDLVAVGNQAEISFDALPDQTFTGQVTHVDTELYQSNNSSEVTGTIELDSIADQIELPIGTSAGIDIIHERADNVMLVPIEALHETTSGRYSVYLVDENGTLTQRNVVIGLQDEIYAEVKSGLNAGDVVSTEPVNSG